MKAVMYHRYGSPEVLAVEEVDRPSPGPDDVLVKVHASVVTAADVAARTGDPVFARLFFGPVRPRAKTLGGGFSGEVEAVGAKVTRFQPRDRVVGVCGSEFGAHAEYLCLSEGAALAAGPVNLTHAEAVAVSDGALTALPFLRDAAGIRSGQEVLVNGAAGAVGSAAVQLAGHFGAKVTAVCSGPNRELVASLGADEVIDYTALDFTRSGRTFDIVFDAVGKSSYSRCRRVLKPDGRYLTTVPSPAIFGQAVWTSWFGRQRAIIAFTGLRAPADKAKDLRFVMALAESGRLRPVIDGRYRLAQAATAHQRVDTGHKVGSVVIIPGADEGRPIA